MTTEWNFKFTISTNQDISHVPFWPLIALYKFGNLKFHDFHIFKNWKHEGRIENFKVKLMYSNFNILKNFQLLFQAHRFACQTI